MNTNVTSYFDQYPGSHRVSHVQITAPLTLEVVFNDGVKGMIRFPPENLNCVFAHFKDPEYFNKVIIEPLNGGTLTWANPNPALCNDPYDPHHVVDFFSDALYFEIMEGNGTFVFGESKLK